MAEFATSADVVARLAAILDDHAALAFLLDNGCCGGTTLSLVDARFVGPHDEAIGAIGEVTVYCSPAVARTARHDHFEVSARHGATATGFSLESRYDFAFQLRRTACAPRL